MNNKEVKELKKLALKHGFKNLVEYEEDIEHYCPEYQDEEE